MLWRVWKNTGGLEKTHQNIPLWLPATITGGKGWAWAWLTTRPPHHRGHAGWGAPPPLSPCHTILGWWAPWGRLGGWHPRIWWVGGPRTEWWKPCRGRGGPHGWARWGGMGLYGGGGIFCWWGGEGGTAGRAVVAAALNSVASVCGRGGGGCVGGWCICFVCI